MSTTLAIIRHGQTEENVLGLLQGHMPGHLTPEGIAMAEALARRLASGEHFDALLCSDLARARHTADIIARHTGLVPQPSPLFRERDQGPWTGRPAAEVRGLPLPEGMETQAQLYDRARRVLDTIARTFPGRRVLLVTHGFFARFILATHAGTGFRSITPMDNAEVRCITLP